MITLDHLQTMKQNGEKIAMLTAYDASLAKVLNTAGVEVLLVGDTLGMVIQGLSTTIPVSLQDIVYHTRCVARGNEKALLMADLPFLTYANPEQAIVSAGQLMQAGAAIVKLEGGENFAETVKRISDQGIPVCGHLGLTPQSVHSLGGFKVQGKYPKQAQKISRDALLLQEAGARMLILECVPYGLAEEITQALTIPVIGIGAGPYCDGQVLVTYDLLGLTQGKPYTFVKNFLLELNELGKAQAYVSPSLLPSHSECGTGSLPKKGEQAKAGALKEALGRGGIVGAIASYVTQVKQGVFPGLKHSFS